MAKQIYISLTVQLYCQKCRRTSYRWWLPFDLEKEGTYFLRCLGCKDDLFTVIVTKDQNIRVYDNQRNPIGYKTQ